MPNQKKQKTQKNKKNTILQRLWVRGGYMFATGLFFVCLFWVTWLLQDCFFLVFFVLGYMVATGLFFFVFG